MSPYHKANSSLQGGLPLFKFNTPVLTNKEEVTGYKEEQKVDNKLYHKVLQSSLPVYQRRRKDLS
jgi:hypothetical protein